MTKNTIATILIIILVFIGAIWLAKPRGIPGGANVASVGTQTPPIVRADEPALTAAETFFNFGAVPINQGLVKHNFKVINSSATAVKISKIYTSCMCTTASIIIGQDRKGPFGMPGHGLVPKANAVIGAGEEATIEVVFDPAAHGPAGVGRIEREIYLEDERGEQTILKFEATVTP